MRFPFNLHTHTTYSDGSAPPEEYVRRALELGFVSLGFSEHGCTTYDEVSIKEEDIPRFRSDIAGLAERYRGRIELYAGVETDYLNPLDKSGWDYVIGSVHYLRDGAGRYHCLDHSPEMLRQAVDHVGGGRARPLVEEYVRLLVDMAERYRPDILGHLDLIVKFNAGREFFDPAQPWYTALWKEACARIAKTGCIVEINSGGMARGWTEVPYPSADILYNLFRLDVPVTVCSDAHSPETLDWAFDTMLDLLRDVGYRTVKILLGGAFADRPLP